MKRQDIPKLDSVQLKFSRRKQFRNRDCDTSRGLFLKLLRKGHA